MGRVEATRGWAKAPLEDLHILRRILTKWKNPWYQTYPEMEAKAAAAQLATKLEEDHQRLLTLYSCWPTW
jgi:hypothetical protein